MRIKLESISVTEQDQDKALQFYTEKLGFIKKQDFPVGTARFLSVVSPDDPDGTELMLEPNSGHPPTKAYKTALYEEGVPATAFEVDDIEAEYDRLSKLGVTFKGKPSKMGDTIAATLDDTCGNLIMIYEKE